MTLVLALLIMSAITAVAVGLSVLLANETITTRGITFAVTSYYGSESAIESGLWVIKDSRQQGLDIDETITRLGTDIAPTSGQLTDPRVTWEREAASLSQSIEFDMGKDQSAFLQLFNPDLGQQTYADAPRKIKLEWTAGSGANVQLTWTGWDPLNGFAPNSGQIYPVSSGVLTDLTDLSNPANQPTRLYLQIRAFDDAVQNLVVTSYKNDGTPIDIPSQIILTARGTFPQGALSSTQALSASVPWLLPVSGIYSYVLFSEDPLDKP